MRLVIAESQHEAVEEEIFWPAVREAVADGDRLADTAIAQEEQGKKLLQQLEDCEAGSAEFEKAFAEFARAAREHIEFEEQEVWPAFRSAVSAEQMEDLGRRLAAAKKMAPTRPHPHTPSSGTVQGTMGKAAAVVDHVRDKLSGRADEAPSQAPPA